MPNDPVMPKARTDASTTVSVAVPVPVSGLYDYLTDGQGLPPGQLVSVPLGGREETGVVWGAGRDDVAPAKLKPVGEALPLPPMPQTTRDFLHWVADYTLSPLGAVVRMAIGAVRRYQPPKQRTGYRATSSLPDNLRLTEARNSVLAVLSKSDSALTATEIARQAQVTTGVITAMAKAGAIAATDLPPAPATARPDPDQAPPDLSADQQKAADTLCAATPNGFAPFLLHGVTGSGKTEVYLEAAATALRSGKQVLILLPEIGLTDQGVARLTTRFGAAPAVWHSEVSAASRRDIWCGVLAGEVKVVIGARSALFLPFVDLGLIVVDEEHDASFKQEEGVMYHARDMAVVRARIAEIPIVLASATPSLETWSNAQNGKYAYLHLPERHGGASLPDVTCIDMRTDRPEDMKGERGWLSPTLVTALSETLEAREQALLFLNRRGYAPLTLCRSCGHRMGCDNCSAWVVEHRHSGKLACHHCGFTRPKPSACPSCGTEDSLIPCGPGVERIAEEVATRFPDARAAIVSTDTLNSPKAIAELIAAIQRHDLDILIGTQLLAKGHHFPGLTLVGVVDGDMGLSGWELRAAEQTFQVLSQVAGRAGRTKDRPGRVIIQTHQPDHPVLSAIAKHDQAAFAEAESRDRESAGMPPYGRLASVIVSGPELDIVKAAAGALGACAPKGEGVSVLGPSPAIMALLRGRHRYRLLIRTDRTTRMQPVIRAWLEQTPLPRGARIQVDIDPQSFF